MFLIIEKKEETTFDFSKNSVVLVLYTSKWKLKRF